MKASFGLSFDTREYSLLKISVYTRIMTFVLAFLSDYISPQPEFNDHIFFISHDKQQLTLIASLFKCLVRWDADFFYSIALRGYSTQREHCFFSLFPLMIRGTSYLFRPLMSQEDALLLGGAVVNFIAFNISTIYLYRFKTIIYLAYLFILG